MTIGSVIGYTTYVWLLRVAPLPKIATYAYVNPVVAFVLGAIVLGEADLGPDGRRRPSSSWSAVALIVTARSRSSESRHGATTSRGRRAGDRAPAGAPRRSSPAARRTAARLASASTVRATRRARTMIVIIGLTPIAVGKSEPSPT